AKLASPTSAEQIVVNSGAEPEITLIVSSFWSETIFEELELLRTSCSVLYKGSLERFLDNEISGDQSMASAAQNKLMTRIGPGT
mgnify:CR=1